MKRLACLAKNLQVCNDTNHSLVIHLTDTAATLTASPLEWVKRYHKVEQMPRLSRWWLGLVTVVVMFSMAFTAIRWTSKSVCKTKTNTAKFFFFYSLWKQMQSMQIQLVLAEVCTNLTWLTRNWKSPNRMVHQTTIDNTDTCLSTRPMHLC